MPLAAALFPQPAPVMSDADVFGPVTPPPQAHTLAPQQPAGLSDAEVFGQAPPAATAAPAPSLWDRATANFNEAAGHSLQGAGANVLDSTITGQVVKTLREQGQGEAADRYVADGLKAQQIQQAKDAAMPAWNAGGTLWDKITAGGAALTGQVAGSLTSPEGLVTKIPGVGGLIEQAAKAVAGKVLPKVAAPIGARVVESGLSQAAVNTATDPAVQGLNIAAGKQAAYDPVETALAPVLGFAVGGVVHGATELRGAADAFRSWRAARGVKPDVAPTPDEITAFKGSPELAAFMQTAGIPLPHDEGVAATFSDKLAARRAKEAAANPQDAGGSKTAVFNREQDRLRAEREAVQAGEIDPQAASTAGRAPRPDLPPVIPVTPKGQADVGDLSVRAGIDNADRVKAGVDQQADEAFRMAELQRTRAGTTVADTQPAARPQGVDQQPVHLDEGFPVKILDRKTKEVNGQQVEMATVHRYDPRTGEVDPEAVPYDVPVRQLRQKNYAKEPRMAQDFNVRAEGPGNPERPRTADQPISREQDQTYRTTPQDANVEFPGAPPHPREGFDGDHLGRSPFPNQPEGPGPFRERPTNEDAAIRDFEAREKARQAGQEDDFFKQQRSKGPRPEDNKTSTKARAVNKEGRFDVDDRGFVASDKGGPMKFADQKQAAKWIINEGHKKSADQIFEIENHPSGKGFGVRERGRAEPKPDNEPPPSRPSSHGDASGAAAGSKGGSPGALPPPPAPHASAEQRASAHEDVATSREPEAKAKPSHSLFDEIRRLGGMRDDRGDVRQIMQGYKNPPFKKRVVHDNGQHPDKIREALQADGWFGPTDFHATTGTRPGDSLTDLYDMVDREARGEPVYHPDHAPSDAHMDAELRRSLDEEMNQAGVKDGDSDETAASKLAEYRAQQDRDFAEQQRHTDELARADQENIDGYQREPEGSAEAGAEQSSGPEARASDDIPGWEEEVPGGSDSRASGAERESGKGPEGARSEPRQTRVDGTKHEASDAELKARAARKRAEEKQQNPRAHNDAKQKPADDGLFADQSEKNQSDMFDDPKQAEAAAKVRDTFFSNPAADPESWRELGRMLAESWGWAKDEAGAWTREMQHSMSGFGKGAAPEGETRFQRAWNATRPMRQWVEKMAYSNDGRLRTLAARFKSDAMRDIADKFFAAPRGGAGKAVGEDYFQSINRRRTQWLNQLDEVMDHFRDMELEPQHEAMKQVGRLVQSPGSIRAGTPVGDAAAAIKRILKEAHQYLREAGVDVGEVKDGYLPRVENTEGILKDPKGFLAAATRAYVADGIPTKEARQAAEGWLNRVRLGDWGVHHEGGDFSNSGGGGSNVFTRGRTLSKKADEIMGDFFLRSPADVIPSYINRAVQKAEWSRRFGVRDKNAPVPKGEDKAAWLSDPEGKWKDLKKRIIDEGNGHLIPDVIGIIRSTTGNMVGPTGATKGAISLARTWSALTYLPRALFASLSEPVNIAIRTGNTIDTARAYGETVRQMIPGVKSTAGAKYLHALASDLGFIGEAIDNLTMLQRIGGENGGLLAKKVQGKFFKSIGLTQLTEANRVASVKIGMTFMRRLAMDVSEKTPYSNIARRLFSELGIGADKVDGFARYVAGLDKPTAKDLQAGGDHGDAYQVALGRFVQNTVMAPSGAVKPYYAQHPLGSLIYNLQSFNFAFQKNVMNRIGSMTTDALNPKSGLNPHERLYALMPLINLAPLVAVTYGVSQLRDALFADPARKGRPAPPGMQTASRVASRAGLTGSWDMLFNAFTGARYQHDPLVAALGPILGGGDTLVGNTLSTFGDRNSPNTNTQERKLAASAYSMLVQPALESALLAAAPEGRVLGKVAGTAGVYFFSHPGTRETFTRKLAGPPLPPS